MKITSWTIGMLLISAIVVGCGQQAGVTSTSQNAPTGPSAEGQKFLLDSEPTGAKDVIDARQTAANEDELIITGRIGGRTNPWVEGLAAFSIVDTSLRACSDIPGDLCEKPWDYCCETDKLPNATALVKFVDEQGNLIATGARELLNVTELQTVVVRGRAQRDDAGNLTVLANGIYLRN